MIPGGQLDAERIKEFLNDSGSIHSHLEEQ
jgi:hypothetical protein